MKTKEITLTVIDCELTFNVTTLAYNTYFNDVTSTNKIAPSVQFVNRTIKKEDSEKLKIILDEHPSAAIQIASKLVDDFAPVIEITIKN